eukprot:TRINITY_DN145_c0_g1_i1.p1 TRINITY_DN145_c0_g1~~TRINITY_DN145_c0_g1_i1.p1  ORF type:complete len:585 (-),score=308.17 TRINITY_DN145_c0_g1_i1:85-1806(-)
MSEPIIDNNQINAVDVIAGTNDPNLTTSESAGHPRTASLYVGDLSAEVTEPTLFEIFNQYGQITNVRVCRDRITRRSLGYAYVNFSVVEEAAKAIDALNNFPILGRPCRVMWSQRDPTVRRSNVGNIFISNLAEDINSRALFDTLIQFGDILSCKVVTDELGKSRRFGFAHFLRQEDAQKAIDALRGNMINGSIVYAGLFKTKAERSKEAEQTFTNLYVKHFDISITKEQIRELFEKAGEVKNAIIMEKDGKSRGFGFVNMSNHEEAQKAIERYNNFKWGEQELYVARALRRSERTAELSRRKPQSEHSERYNGLNLYIKNLSNEFDDEKLRNLFSRFGQITSSKVMRDEKGTSRGFGFVCFANSTSAQEALSLHNVIEYGKPLYVALHQRKNQRQQMLQQQYARRPPYDPRFYTSYQTHFTQMPSNFPPSFPHNIMFPPYSFPYVIPPAVAARNWQNSQRPYPRNAQNNRGRRFNANNNNQRRTQNYEQEPQQAISDTPIDLNSAGESIFKFIIANHNTTQENASKITGMIIEAGTNDPTNYSIPTMLTNQAYLTEKISEAFRLLNNEAQTI